MSLTSISELDVLILLYSDYSSIVRVFATCKSIKGKSERICADFWSQLSLRDFPKKLSFTGGLTEEHYKKMYAIAIEKEMYLKIITDYMTNANGECSVNISYAKTGHFVSVVDAFENLGIKETELSFGGKTVYLRPDSPKVALKCLEFMCLSYNTKFNITKLTYCPSKVVKDGYYLYYEI